MARPRPPDTPKCPHCGQPLPEGARYCLFCGAPAGSPAKASDRTAGNTGPLPEAARNVP